MTDRKPTRRDRPADPEGEAEAQGRDSAWQDVLPRRSELRQMKREVLLRRAAAAFNRRGFHATSLEQISNSLGITKTALYYYFPNKHALLTAAFLEALRVAFDSLERGRAEGGSGLERLQLAIQFYLEQSLGDLTLGLILTEEHALLPEDRAVVVERRDRYEAELRALVREGIEDGSIVPCDPKLAIFSIFGAVNWVPKWFSERGAWSNRQLAGAMSRLLCRSIARNPAPTLDTDIAAT